MNTSQSAVVLYQPEIPPNTGNIARTCAATGTPLHLIGPMGFSLEDRYLRRAGLDYWDQLALTVHEDWERFLEAVEFTVPPALLTTKGHRLYTEIPTESPGNDVTQYLIFGPETRGLPEAIRDRWPNHTYRLPMLPTLRSLNLSNSVAIVVYHQLYMRQFPGLT
ncbi:MAG TPA: tRNA (cytidine(34)-2'-O)-methyltransferase [Alkalispirochaeta sp.]|nr:tRNA (cytidine(34)-2'-O)-methyltransferase [Alkalispirochaeta sp.]